MTQIIKLDFSRYNGSAATPIGWYTVHLVKLSASKYYGEFMAAWGEVILGFTKTEEEGRQLCTKDFEGKVKACLIL